MSTGTGVATPVSGIHRCKGTPCHHVLLKREVGGLGMSDRAELDEQLRLHGISNVQHVARAYMEPDGEISVIRADHRDTSTPHRHPPELRR